MKSQKKSYSPLLVKLGAQLFLSVWKQIVGTMLLALIVSYLYIVKGFNFINQPTLANLIPGVVLGLLLVFRTNTAYERFWEGRKMIGGIIDIGRFLSRQLWVEIPEKMPSDREDKLILNRLLSAFFVATKLHLRRETVNPELEMLVSQEQALQLRKVGNMPLKVTQWVSEYVMRWHQSGYIDSIQLVEYNNLLNKMVEYMGNCERILNTPLPIAYASHLENLITLYLFSTPFQLVAQLGWITIPATGIISFALLGIEGIGAEIENPFGYDLNDIPLDRLCDGLKDDIEELYI